MITGNFLNRHDIRLFKNIGLIFIEGHFTSYASLKIVNNVRSQLDNGNNVLVLYLDLKKAFDTVDHAVLIKKLSHYRIRGTAYTFCQVIYPTESNVLFLISIRIIQTSPLEYHNVPFRESLHFLTYVGDIQNAASN